MGMFDSIVGLAKERAGLSDDRAGGLVAALLRLISDPNAGGFGGFIDRFRSAGLGSVMDSWISRGDNTPISNEQVESALGADGIAQVADEAGVDRGAATSAIAGVLPGLVDSLTPDGDVPDESMLLSKVGGFLSNWGGAIGGAVAGGIGAATAGAAQTFDRVDAAAGATYSKGKEALGSVGDSLNVDSGGGSILKWLLPLLLLGLVLVLGFWFCGRGTTPVSNTAVNVNANRPAANVNANRPAVNANANANANTNTGAAKTLGEVSLPNGTKLQAYPGGIEDQLVKFIGSDDYKNGAAATLKDKWFNFDDLNFVFGKTELTPESKRQLDNITAILKAYPDVKIKIGGYSDKKGDDAANLKLSDSRAKAVQAALQKAGVGGQVPEAEGYGEQFATVAEDATDEARKADRKTAIRLIK